MNTAKTRVAKGEPDEAAERQLMRWLHDELPAAERAELAARLAVDPRLAASFARLRAAWDGLELPAERPVPAAFRRELMAKLEGEHRRRPASGFHSLGWARMASALALVAGIGMGTGATLLVSTEAPVEPDELAAEDSLADDYWTAFRGGDAGGQDWPGEDEP